MPANVLYSGLAPGFAGLYQLNVQVPQNAPVGDQFVTLTMHDVVSDTGITSNAPLLPVEVSTISGTSVGLRRTAPMAA